MRKGIFTWMAAAVMTMAMTMTAFAGSWQQDTTGWWWLKDDGSYAHTGWEWLDGDGDGVAECYYFGADGYLLTNTITPDGYTVNASGAWEVNHVVQQKAAEQSNPLIGTWKGYEELTGYATTYIFYSDGTVAYDIVSQYSGYRMFGVATYTLNGSQILIDSNELYVNFAGNMRLEGNQIIAEDEAEDGAFDVIFQKQ